MSKVNGQSRHPTALERALEASVVRTLLPSYPRAAHPTDTHVLSHHPGHHSWPPGRPSRRDMDINQIRWPGAEQQGRTEHYGAQGGDWSTHGKAELARQRASDPGKEGASARGYPAGSERRRGHSPKSHGG